MRRWPPPFDLGGVSMCLVGVPTAAGRANSLTDVSGNSLTASLAADAAVASVAATVVAASLNGSGYTLDSNRLLTAAGAVALAAAAAVAGTVAAALTAATAGGAGTTAGIAGKLA